MLSTVKLVRVRARSRFFWVRGVTSQVKLDYRQQVHENAQLAAVRVKLTQTRMGF